MHMFPTEHLYLSRRYAGQILIFLMQTRNPTQPLNILSGLGEVECAVTTGHRLCSEEVN